MERRPSDEEPTVFLPRSHPTDEATSATLLDDAVWGMPAPGSDVHPTATATSTPTAATSTVPASGGLGNLTAVWHGPVPEPSGAPYTAGPRHRRGLVRGWLAVAGAALAAVLLLVRQQAGEPLSVTGATARPSSSSIGCDTAVEVLGTIRSNGEGGTVSYRWRRSDGAVSGPVQQRIAPGARLTDVTLRWTFHGPGSMNATAVLEVLSPNPARAEAAFTYTCR